MKPSIRTPLLLTISLLAAALFLTRGTIAKDDWLPIDPADLALKDNPMSPGAHAMILYRESFIDVRGHSRTDYLRVKIFTEEGKKEGDVEIPYDKHTESIRDIRARTIHADGSVVDFSGTIYEKEIAKAGGIKHLAKTFSLPDVQPGCILEYKFKRELDESLIYLPEWVVQEDMFTRLGKFSLMPDPGIPLYWRTYKTPPNVKPETQKDGSITMEIHNLPGLDEEDYMPPKNFLRARVEFVFRHRDDPQNETADQYWKRIDKAWYEGLEKFIDKKKALQEVVSQTISPGDAPEVKLQKLYARAQQIHNWQYDPPETKKEVKREKLKENLNVEDVLKHDYGNGSDVNYLFCGLARAAGFESSIVYVAPRNRNFFYPSMQDAGQLGAQIVWVKLSNQDIYLDPASKFFPYPYLPWYENGTVGIRLDKQTDISVTVPISAPSETTRERHADVQIDDEGNLTGKLEITYLHGWAAIKREDERDDDEAGKKKDMTDEVKGMFSSSATFEITSMSGWDKIGEPLKIEGTVTIPGYAASAGHRVLVPITPFLAQQPHSFQPEKRTNAIYFPYPLIENDTITVHVPSGYKIETLPAAQKSSPGAGFEYSVASNQVADSVTVERHLTITGVMFQATQYNAIRSFFNKVKTNDDGQIVLQPTQTAKGN